MERARLMFDDMTDEQLLALEESLYDDMVAGDSDAAERHDDVVVEMNARGMFR